MLLYRYFASHAYETLDQGRLMLARPSALNDPFEFVYRSSGEMTLAKAKQYLKRRINSNDFYNAIREKHSELKNKKQYKLYIRKNLNKFAQQYFDEYDSIAVIDPAQCHDMADEHFRLGCFSETTVDPHEEILMWSHYADKHKGVRIKFSLDESKTYPYFIRKITYSKDRVPINLADYSAESENLANIKKAMSTKAEGWAYEKEWRYFTAPRFCHDETADSGVTRSFINFKINDVVGVDFGLKCQNIDMIAISDVIKKKYPHVELRKATYHKSQFAIEYVNI